MKKIPEWATHYVEMMDGGKFFVESNGCMSKPPQFECISDFGGQNPWSELKSLVIGIDEYKSNLKEEKEFQWLFFDAPEPPKTVRPIMTVEARDVLDKMHETCKCDTRSESIVSYHTSNLKMREQNSKLQDEIQRMKISDLKKSELSTKALEKQKQKTRDCKFISWLMTAALFALLAVTIFNAS